MANVYKTTVAEEIIGHDNGRKHVLVTVATSYTDATEGEAVGSILTGGKIRVTLSKVGKISSIVPLPIGMVAGANASLTCNIAGEGNTVTVGEDNTVTVGEGNTVTITVLKAGEGNLAAATAADGDLVPEGGGDGVTFNFIAIGL